ncbi:MAG: hypothetical protein KBD24_00555 [Candidatus Pacebacteria bacterium]|nr:hypothetical protein [Candidatus Paceibacterota bacterium]
MNTSIMSTQKNILKSARTHVRTVVATALLAVLTLGTLYLFEGILAQGGADKVHASGASCSISASIVGNSTTLSWSIVGGDVTEVRIDRFPGQTFAREGSVVVTPTDTTTYTATATGPTETVSCSTTVTVQSPTGQCETAVLSVDGNTFTWAGCPYMERYKATFCDGSNTGDYTYDVNDDWKKGSVTIDLTKRIASVQACGDGCERVVEQSCPPPPPDPVYPSCPFTADANTAVVTFDRTKIYSNSTTNEYKTRTYPISLSAGTYTVKTASWDGYPDRVTVSQPKESWYADLLLQNQSKAHTGATTDLADNVAEAFREETVNTSLVLSSSVDTLFAQHAAYFDDASYNSVHPVCIAFTKHTTPNPETPSCSLTLSPSSVRKGASATLSWSGSYVTSGSIDQGVGTVNTSGSTAVTPANTTTYTGTFIGTNGTQVSCATTLSITTGGGGKCLNCDDDDKVVTKKTVKKDVTPSIVLAKTITKAGSYITLDQVPYTGFEAGPVATMFFWMTILALSALIAYLFTRFQPIAYIRSGLMTSPENLVAGSVHGTMHAPSTSSSLLPSVNMSQQVYGIADDNGAGKIEDLAHGENILLSPEATRMIMLAIGQSGQSTDTFLSALFDKVVATYPREDGWILLSQERASALLVNGQGTVVTPAEMSAPVQSGPVADLQRKPLSTTHDDRPHRMDPPSVARAVQVDSVTTTPAVQSPVIQTQTTAPLASPVADSSAPKQQSDVESIIPLFVDLMIAGDQKKAFELLRRLTAQGVSSESLVMCVIRKLDDIYKNRLEGNHNPDKDLAMKTATWSNGDFEKVLGILVECVDYSYSSNRIGTKVALTKVFEYFGQKAK